MPKIKKALISLSDKSNLLPLLKCLKRHKINIISSGGTYKIIKKLKFNCSEISDFTKFPEILNGRVKTLHPKIHAGILSKRKNKKHIQELKKNKFENIDLIIVNFYPFEQVVKKSKSHQKIIENIDIGGPTMVRAAAKNYNDVTVLTSIHQYEQLISELITNRGSTSLNFRQKLSEEAFAETAYYDSVISSYFNKISKISFPHKKIIHGNLIEKLRYGENPHQEGWFKGNLEEVFSQLHGKQISYNNLLDIDAAIMLMEDFSNAPPTFAILKHNNACGFATRSNLLEAYGAALQADPISAFGGILIANNQIDLETATKINTLFCEVVIAPSYDLEALELLKSKKNRIILVQNKINFPNQIERSCLNGILVQERDVYLESVSSFELKTDTKPSDSQMEDLNFANKLAKHTKSNTIVLVKDLQLLASGTGQTSRVDALNQAINKAKAFNFDLTGSVMASDAFFPFPDCVEIAGKEGINAVIQPGGSIKDDLSVDYCNKNQIGMVFTGIRHFKH